MNGYKRIAALIMVLAILFSIPVAFAANYRPSDFSGLEIGCSGESVFQLQLRLRQLGYFDDEINGQYAQSTAEAVEAFAEDNDLDYPNYASPELQAALFSDDARNIDGVQYHGNKDNDSTDYYAYMGNSNTGVFHHMDCYHVKRIHEDHRVPCTRAEAIQLGYRPCKVCKP